MADDQTASAPPGLSRGVLFVAAEAVDAATNRYRCVHPAAVLAAQGVRTEVVSIRQANHVRIDYDIVVLHRVRWQGIGSAVAAAARRAGATVVYSMDDLICRPEYAYHQGAAFPKDSTAFLRARREVDDVVQGITAADAVIVSTEFLASQVRRTLAEKAKMRSTPPVMVLRNSLSVEMLRLSDEAHRSAREVPRDSDDRVRIGYLSGSPTHDGDLADIAVPLEAALARTPGARLLIVGPVKLPPLFRSLVREGRVQHHPYVPWRDLPGLIAGLDLNLAPLDPTQLFNHAKSEIKFLEAGAVGVPTLTGRTAGVAEAVTALTRPGEAPPCILAGSLDEWSRSLTELIADAPARQALGERARQVILGANAASEIAVRDTFAHLAGLGERGAQETVTVRFHSPREKAVSLTRSLIWAALHPRHSVRRIGRYLVRG